MASANKVRSGQVWTAKVSGKPTQVEVLAEAGVTASGRKTFTYKNLTTGRTATGTAGKLKSLVRAAPNPTAPAVAPPPLAAHAPARRAPPKRPNPFVSRIPTPAAADDDEPEALQPAYAPAVPRPRPAPNTPLFGRAPRPEIADQRVAPAPPLPRFQLPPSRASSPLSSLRGTASSPFQAPAASPLSNPRHYPSDAAQSAAEALASSSAQNPDQVMAVMQAWYASMLTAYYHPTY